MATAVMLGFLSALLFGCDPADHRSDGEPAPHIEFHATLSSAADRLNIDYQLSNTGTTSVVLFVGLPAADTTADPTVDPNAVYVVTGSGDNAVQISKQVFAPPAGVDPAAPFLLRGVVLAGGEHFSQQLTVPMPLTVRRPYQGAMAHPPALPDVVRQVRFCVGVAQQDWVHPVPASGGGDTRPIYPQLAAVVQAQHLFCAPDYQLPT